MLSVVPASGQTAQRRSGAHDLAAATTIDRFIEGGTLVDVLQSRAPGLIVERLPDGYVNLHIRSAGAMRDRDTVPEGNHSPETQPLVIVDGMPLNADFVSPWLQSVDPAQIERIQVLKDIASTSMYGSRGHYGVILITMKRR